MDGNNHRFLGRAGEYRVATELLLRGINVAFLAVDDGVDLLANGKRIQVKTSKKEFSSSRGYKYPAYLFTMRSKKYINSHNVTIRPKFRKDIIDFLICWCVDHDWFYIIPAKEVNQTMINIPIENQKSSKYQKYLGAWDSLKEDN